MERYHDTSRDPLPLVSPQHEIERQRLADATAAFLASGGQVQQVGFQMKDAPETFVINAKKTPVYAHLFVPPEPEPLRAKAQPAPTVVQVEPVQQLVVTKSRRPGMTTATLASRLMVQAALGATPGEAARAIGIHEKQARQVARDHNIKFKRQR
ncbi:hypothetical protein [Aquipseudomonas campi]